MKSLSKYIIFSISVLIIYTIASMVIFIKTGMEYSTLTTCFYAAFGGEILTCGLIKIFKLREGDNDHDNAE